MPGQAARERLCAANHQAWPPDGFGKMANLYSYPVTGPIERRSGIRSYAVTASIAQPHGSGALAPRYTADREALLLAIEHAGLRAVDVVSSSLASAAATLDAAEREAGIALADIGAGTVDVVLYRGGEVVGTQVIEQGGADLTASIATRFQLSLAEAEFLKRNVGCASPVFLESDGIVAVPRCLHGAGTAVTRREIARLILTRLIPLWHAVASMLVEAEEAKLECGIAITGGGSLLDGMSELAASSLEIAVRRASPFGLIDLPGELQGPGSATIAGLAHYAIARAAQSDWRRTPLQRRRLASA